MQKSNFFYIVFDDDDDADAIESVIKWVRYQLCVTLNDFICKHYLQFINKDAYFTICRKI